MLIKAIRYITLFLIFLNFPGWVLDNFNPILSSALSYLSFGLTLLYFILAKEWNFNSWLLLLGLVYFGISSLSGQIYLPDLITYMIIIIKYFILIIGGYIMLRHTSKKEIFYFLLIGALSVFLQMFVFYNKAQDYGRYSGFYLNPNSLAFICMMGYGLTYGLKTKLRTWGQIIFTFIGFLTFSRTFIVVWLLMNLISIRLSLKNIRVLAIGLGLFIGLLTFNAFLPKSNPRLEAMANILEGNNTNTKKLEEGGRSDTWAAYYPALLEKPFFGNGYGSFAGGGIAGRVGPHNAYLKVIGEAGIITLLIMILMFGKMTYQSAINFLKKPYLLLMIVSLDLFLLANHNFFDSGYVLFFIMWLQIQLNKNENSTINNNNNNR
ncbi:O-antigen ligase family protein [Maribacter litoralis]|uniref:O-Antigen ligase n=1 Tax=Maribacter litoralis TaxID=2059726 RepID=A0A653VAZ9_9FLAO|nr:O-antigen ligase family protein [Maribacter litoralis]VXC03327.1 O-Antigen ligase [Maribacter litoralis]